MGKADTLLAAMDSNWQHCAPTGARMLEGVLKIKEVPRAITEAKGAVVPGELYCTGRRWRRADDKGDCERKPAKRQRKDANEFLMDPPRARALFDKPSV
jgi:hypothetical protein